MKAAGIFLLVGGLFVLAFFSLIYAEVPQMINYQGKITTPAGALVDTTVGMVFTIYNAPTDGGVLWTETQPSVVVAKGVFSVLMGSVNAIPDSVFTGDVRYLGVKVGADPEMTPRKKMVSVGYAYKAEYSDTAEYSFSGARDDDWDIDTAGINVYRLTGNVGIGMPIPQEKLDVAGTAQVTGFKMPTSASDGYVLTSDASGVGTWQAAAAGGDIDWTFRITDTADTTLMTGGEWGIARSGNILYGNADSTHVNLGVASVTGASGQNYKYCTVGGGRQNVSSSPYATVGGGYNNTAGGVLGDFSTIGGGANNKADGYVATVGGGRENNASGGWTTVGGGQYNKASGYTATVAGGYGNCASEYFATVPGGVSDTAAGACSFAAGEKVKVDGNYTFAYGKEFTTSRDNAVVFSHPSYATRVGINLTNPTYAITLPNNANNSGQGMANAWNTYSSIRWKENISPIDDALDKVLALRGVYFDWKEGKKRNMGLIAEEVGEVIPEVVTYEENGVDAEGLDYTRLTALLVEAIKEQQKRISALEKQIVELKR